MERDRAASGLTCSAYRGACDVYSKATGWRRRRDLREAGYVVVDDEREAVTVELGAQLEAALAEFG